MTVDRVFSAGEPPPSGYDDADVNTVMAAARAFVAADEDVSPVPRDTCCDRYTYRVTLGYADGTSKSFTAVDGVRQPKAFELLLRAVA